MTPLRRFWRWFTTPHKDTTQEALKDSSTDQTVQGWIADEHERERQEDLATLPEPPDLSDAPGTSVPPPHPGQVTHVDLTKQMPPGEQAPSHLVDVTPSDWDLLTPTEQALFEQITPHDESKTIRYPAPTEQTTQEWVTERLAKAGFSEEARLRFAGFRRVAVGMSMRHLGDLKRRAEARDASLSVHDLIALRTRGIA